MSDCLIKAFADCACPPGECLEKPLTPAPVTFVSWRTQAIACLTFGFLVAIVTAAWMETQFKNQDLSYQERVSWK